MNKKVDNQQRYSCNDSIITKNFKSVFGDDVYIRFWQKGDYFYPLGVNGKKKISDWFNDVKLNEEEKLNTKLLMHQNDVLAIIGYRVDKRFVVNENTKLITKISWKMKI